MNCERFEKHVALYAGGELRGRELHRMERHVEECPGCRQQLEELRAIRSGLSKLRDEPVSGEALMVIREKVLARISGPVPSRWRAPRWAWGSVALGLGVAFALLLSQRQQKPPAPPLANTAQTPVLRQAVPPASGARTGVPRRPKPRRQVLSPQAAALPEQRPERGPAEPIVVKLFTSDPNIVIIWLMESDGG